MKPLSVFDARRRSAPPLSACLSLAVLALACASAGAADTTPAQQLERFSAQAGSPAQAERGRNFFTTTHGGEWSCSTCHGKPPTSTGKHASTGKPIDPMAPAVNPKVFTDSARVEKWFRRNCKDVVQRECSPGEKADVLAYLISLKP
jgi:Domain of unknown function (DUF1924)